MDTIRIKISPEFLKTDIISETYDGNTFGVYSGLSQMLSGGTNGSSLFTGLTIPIVLNQDYHDIGYYSVFDGDISQQNVNVNFLFSATTGSPCTYYVYNTTESTINYLQDSTYQVDWGDGTPVQSITNFSPDYISHVYSQCNANTPQNFVITLTQFNSFGILTVQKTVEVPFTDVQILNPLGTVTFVSQGGSWSTSPSSYNFTWTGDSNLNLYEQSSPAYVSVPYAISGSTQSRLRELALYGSNPYQIGVNISIPDCSGCTGTVTNIQNGYTAYTINNIDYLDFSGGTSVFVAYSSGLTESMLHYSAITKNEVLMNVIDDFQIQTTVLIERGVNSGLENFRRIGEVGTAPGLTKYGYGFFNVVKS